MRGYLPCLGLLALSGACLAANADLRPTLSGPTLERQSRALQRAHEGVVGVQVRAVEDARSLATLGRERAGSGVLISESGLVLTIGYLLLEAEQAALLTHEGRMVPARVVAVDQATGLGLLQALAPMGLAPAPIASGEATSRLQPGQPLLMASGGFEGEVGMARWAGRKPYSANWEYHLDQALFTTPPRQDQAGAALFNLDGELLGIGSLRLPDVAGPNEPRQPGNLFVPAELLPPVLAELLGQGRSRSSERAWLGLNCDEAEDGVRILRVAPDSPADVAGLEPGDKILAVDGQPVRALAQLWKAVWAQPLVARAVQLDIQREGRSQSIVVYSVDREWTLRRPEGV